MKWYIAGPMSNRPFLNFPAFDAAAGDLRSRGFEVVSPAELDNPVIRAAALVSADGSQDVHLKTTGETWGDLLARDIRLIADHVDGVAVLPGWRNSRGARLETFVAFLCGKPVVYYPSLRRVPRATMFSAWTGRDARK